MRDESATAWRRGWRRDPSTPASARTPDRMRNPWTTKLSQVAHLPRDDRELLDRLISRPTRFESGRNVISQGQPPEHVNVVVSGWVARYKVLKDGERQIMALMLPGDVCDIHAYVLKAMDHSLTAIGEAEVAMLPRQEVAAILDARPMLASALWWSSLQNEAILREWITSLGRRNAYKRTAHLLYELYVRLQAAGLPCQSGIDFPLTQTDLSDALGLSGVHINRVLQRLREEQLIVLRRGRLDIPNPPALAQAAEFDASYLHLDEQGGAVAGGLRPALQVDL